MQQLTPHWLVRIPVITTQFFNHTALAAALCIGMCAAAGAVRAADPVRPTGAHAAPDAEIGVVLAQAAASVGVLSCAGRIDRLSQFIGANAQVGAYFFAPPAQPDARLVSFSYEVRGLSQKTPLAYASASFAPNQANGCGAAYEAVVYWPKKCTTVARQQFADFKPGRSLQKEILVLESTNPTRVFLMPAGSGGCVSIKKELVL